MKVFDKKTLARDGRTPCTSPHPYTLKDTENRSLQRLTENMSREVGKGAPTDLAWAAFVAWCDADEERFRSLAKAFQLSSVPTAG